MSGLAALPLESMDLGALGTFLRFYAAPYYKTVDTISDIQAETAKTKSDPKYSPRVIVSDIYTNAARDTSLGMLADFNLQNTPIPRLKVTRVNSGGNKAIEMLATAASGIAGMFDINVLKNRQDYMRKLETDISDLEKGWLDVSPLYTEEQLGKDRRLGLEFEYVLENRTNQQAAVYTMVEELLYEYLAVADLTGNLQTVWNSFRNIIEFYDKYGMFAPVTSSAEAAKRNKAMEEKLKDSPWKSWVMEIIAVRSPDMAKEKVIKMWDDYFSAIERGQILRGHQDSQPPETLADNQNLANDMTISHVLIGQTNAALQKMLDLPNNIYDTMRAPGVQSVTFDVDEEAIRNNTKGNINVYLQFQSGDTKQLLSIKNDGLQRDVTVNAGQGVFNALLEALSATQ
jgi:hypothetical protein